MKIAVIGGSGFIGSHIVDKLIEKNHDVTIFDIMTPHRNDVKHIFVDLLDFHKLTIALAGDYDILYLLAAMSNVNDVYRNPLEAGLLNIQGVINVLEVIRRIGKGRLIFASTIWVYSLAKEEQVDEDTPLLPKMVNHPYIASKIAAELYIWSYHKLYGCEFTILRYGIPYGPRGRMGTIISNFVDRALRGEPLIIYGDGNQYRNFIYVEDLAEGNVAALADIARNQVYNLDGIRPITVKEVAETVARLIKGTKIEYKEARPGDFKGKNVSSEKAYRELNWKPKIDLEEGIRRYIEWYKKNVLKIKN